MIRSQRLHIGRQSDLPFFNGYAPDQPDNASSKGHLWTTQEIEVK